MKVSSSASKPALRTVSPGAACTGRAPHPIGPRAVDPRSVRQTRHEMEGTGSHRAAGGRCGCGRPGGDRWTRRQPRVGAALPHGDGSHRRCRRHGRRQWDPGPGDHLRAELRRRSDGLRREPHGQRQRHLVGHRGQGQGRRHASRRATSSPSPIRHRSDATSARRRRASQRPRASARSPRASSTTRPGPTPGARPGSATRTRSPSTPRRRARSPTSRSRSPTRRSSPRPTGRSTP